MACFLNAQRLIHSPLESGNCLWLKFRWVRLMTPRRTTQCICHRVKLRLTTPSFSLRILPDRAIQRAQKFRLPAVTYLMLATAALSYVNKLKDMCWQVTKWKIRRSRRTLMKFSIQIFSPASHSTQVQEVRECASLASMSPRGRRSALMRSSEPSKVRCKREMAASFLSGMVSKAST